MKRIIFIMLAFTLFTACDDSKKESIRTEIKEAIKITNELIGGKQMDYMTVCDKVEFRNDNVYYYYTFDESYASVEDVRNNINVIKNQTEMTMENNKDAKELAEMIAKIDGKFVYTYTGNMSGRSVSFEIIP